MFAKRARISALVSSLLLYIALAYLCTLNFPISSTMVKMFLVPIPAIVITLLISGFLTKGKTKNIKNDEFISAYQFWAMILLPIILGLIAIVYVITGGSYTEISWIIMVIGFSIGSNGLDLIRGKSNSIRE